MKAKTVSRMFKSMMAGSLIALPAFALASAQQSELLNFIPSDVHVVSISANTGEDDFIKENWANVWDEFQKVGLGQELWNFFMGNVDDAQTRQLIETQTANLTDLVSNFDFSAMTANETAFVLRYSMENMVIDPSTGTFVIGPPDMMWFFSGENTEQNFNAIKGMIDYALAMEEEAAEFIMQTSEELNGFNVHTYSIPVQDFLRFSIFHNDDFVGISLFNPNLFGEITSRINSNTTSDSIASNPRFTEAFADLPEGSLEIGYFDAASFFVTLNNIFDSVLSAMKEMYGDQVPPQAEMADVIGGNIFRQVAMFDRSASVSYAKDGQKWSQSHLHLAPNSRNLALGRLVAHEAHLENPYHFLPKETKNFQMNASPTPLEAWSGIEELAREVIPGADMFLMMFEQQLSQAPIDVRQDVLSWMGGKSISIAFEQTNPMASADWLMAFEVTDTAMALEKTKQGLTELANFVNSQNPQLGITVRPHAQLGEKYVSLTSSMIPLPGFGLVIGVDNDFMTVSNSAAPVTLFNNTITGNHPNITENEQFMRNAFPLSGPVTSVQYQDLSTLGQDLGMSIMMMSTFGGLASAMNPDVPPEFQQFIRILQRAGSVVAKIDFLESSFTSSSIHSDRIHTVKVTSYKQ